MSRSQPGRPASRRALTSVTALRDAMRDAQDAYDQYRIENHAAQTSAESDYRMTWLKAAADYYLALHPEDAKWRHAPSKGIPSVQEIQERAAIFDAARKAVPRHGRIDPDPERRDAWSAQVGWSYETMHAVYTEAFSKAFTTLVNGDPGGFEYCLRFLEADPLCFNANRTKAKLCYPVASARLEEFHRARIRRVILTVVDDPRRRRGLRHYGRLAWAVGTPSLEAELTERASTFTDRQVRYNARCVLEAWQRLPERELSGDHQR